MKTSKKTLHISHSLCLPGIALLLSLCIWGTTSCTEEPVGNVSKSGSMGPITADRAHIGTGQPFTLSSQVTPGHEMLSEVWTWVVGSHQCETVASDGRTTFTTSIDKAGPVSATLTYLGEGRDAKIYTGEQTLDLNITPTDIRNSFWGESADEVKRNVLYTTDSIEADSRTIKFHEPEKIMGTNFAKGRDVEYDIAGGQLNSVTYLMDLSGDKDRQILWGMRIRLGELTRNQGYGALSCSYELSAGQTLTEAQQTLLVGFTDGSWLDNKNYDDEGLVGHLVKAGTIGLTISGQNGRTKVLTTVSHDADTGLTTARQQFTPQKK